MPPMKRRRPEYPDMGGGGHMGGYGDSVPHPRGGPPSHSLADMDMLQQENMLLKSRVEELKKQVQVSLVCLRAVTGSGQAGPEEFESLAFDWSKFSFHQTNSNFSTNF